MGSREKYTTSQLKLGDVVLNHGMRILLDTPAVTFPNPGTTVCYSWVGTVLNPEEAVKEGIPRTFLCEDRYVDGEGWTRVQTNRWNVQGNDLATWIAERG
jgi:hypothetical protein